MRPVECSSTLPFLAYLFQVSKDAIGTLNMIVRSNLAASVFQMSANVTLAVNYDELIAAQRFCNDALSMKFSCFTVRVRPILADSFLLR